MESLWGGIDPLPQDRIHVVEDGDTIDLGGRKLTAIETPGHAGHHHAYLDDGTGYVFTGDALGVSPRGIGAFRPATPPPEFNLEMALASIDRIRGAGATALWLTHYGPADAAVDEACTQAGDALKQWAHWVERARASSRELDEVTDLVQEQDRKELEGRLDEEGATRMEMTTSYRMNVSGYMRYFDKKEKA
jgi:glyoxylase-like metal-dependent hydrolase (beta-lactamase superfamily II)